MEDGDSIDVFQQQTGGDAGTCSTDDDTHDLLPHTDAADAPPPQLDLEGKIVIDPKDPNRPRFTLDELRKVGLRCVFQ